MKEKFLYSVIIPVYNVEEYLDETIQSVIDQKKIKLSDIQVLLINDGSTDGSGEVCRKWADRFPKSIKYIEQENRGVSAARNRGIKESEGRYVIFLDSDDKLSSNTLRAGLRFLDAHNHVDVAALKIEYFDAVEGPHWISSRFHKDEVVDINEDYAHGIFSASAAIFRGSAVRRHRFAEGIRIAEDGRFVTEIVLKSGYLGLVYDPVYYYRKRSGDSESLSSTIRTSNSDEWFLKTPREVYKYLIEYSQNELGFVHRYVQYYIMSQLQYRFLHSTVDRLSEEDYGGYRSMLDEILQYIDDEVILEQCKIRIEHKLYILGRKYSVRGLDSLKLQQGVLYFKRNRIFNYRRKTVRVIIDAIDHKEDGSIVISGRHTGFRSKDVYLVSKLKHSKEEAKVSYDPGRTSFHKVSQYDTIYDSNCFSLTLDQGGLIGDNLHFYLAVGKNKKAVELDLKRYVGIHPSMRQGYYSTKGVLVFRRGGSILFRPKTRKALAIREARYLVECLRRGVFDVVFIRILYHLLVALKRQEVWVISDRLDDANDNGRYLFQYVNGLKGVRLKAWFTVDKKSPTYKELRRLGRVVPYGSFKARLRFLLADKIISSQSRDACYIPFSPQRELYYSNIQKRQKFIFLSHGVHQGDTSRWLNRYLKRYDLLTVSSDREKKSFINDKYGYKIDNISTTGLPRYDVFYKYAKEHGRQKLIVFAPTWRKHIVADAIDSLDHRGYNDAFKDTDYFKFYNGLMNDGALLSYLKKYGYKMVFLSHPNIGENIKDFQENDFVHISTPPHNYRKYLGDGAALVTDYSSVGFDFAYLKRPVIYTHFDVQDFKKHHGWNFGYFSFEQDGFGPVVYSYKDAVKVLKGVIKNDSKLSVVYKKRIENFFYKFDADNSKRVYEAILALDK